MFPLTKMQAINYIKKNDDCRGDCSSCLLRKSKLIEIGVNPVSNFCSERFLMFVRKISAKDLKMDREIINRCIGRQKFLFKLAKKFTTVRLLSNED